MSSQSLDIVGFGFGFGFGVGVGVGVDFAFVPHAKSRRIHRRCASCGRDPADARAAGRTSVHIHGSANRCRKTRAAAGRHACAASRRAGNDASLCECRRAYCRAMCLFATGRRIARPRVPAASFATSRQKRAGIRKRSSGCESVGCHRSNASFQQAKGDSNGPAPHRCAGRRAGAATPADGCLPRISRAGRSWGVFMPPHPNPRARRGPRYAPVAASAHSPIRIAHGAWRMAHGARPTTHGAAACLRSAGEPRPIAFPHPRHATRPDRRAVPSRGACRARRWRHPASDSPRAFFFSARQYGHIHSEQSLT